MRYVKYEGEIPNVKRNYNKHERYFEGFMRSNIKIAKIDIEDDYKTLKSAYNCLNKAANIYDYPIKICKRSDEIFIVRTDM